MKEKGVFFNPFRMLSPKLEKEAVKLEKLHEEQVSESASLEEGVLIVISKLIEMTRLLGKSLVTDSVEQMDVCDKLAGEVHRQEKILTKGMGSFRAEADVYKSVIRFPYRLERVGDLLESVLRCARAKQRDGVHFSEKAQGEVTQLFTALAELMINLRDGVRTPNKLLLEAIIAQGNKIGLMAEEFKVAHWERLEAGFCSVDASSLYRDILDSVKWANEYLGKIAGDLLELGQRRAQE
jgi:Na+/phosphate symporter